MKIVTYNIQFGRGRDHRVDLERITEAVRGADIIVLQEVDRYWPRSGNTDQIAALSTLLPDYYWAYGAGLDVFDPSASVGQHPQGQRRQFGNLLLSRYPLRSVRNHLLPQYTGLHALSIQRSALEVLIETRSAQLRLYNLHLTHLSAETRNRQLRHLL
ncbi:MAG TPA: hydrolase, partial [Gammaproteobacteria bacterium]|nr:hydrolase [Gammaproteobacteria bacterium]